MPGKHHDHHAKDLKLGEKVRALRAGSGMGLEALAGKVGVPAALLRQIEAGEIHPTVATLLRIGRAFGVGLEAFFAEEGEAHRIEIIRKGARTKVRRSRLDGATPLSYSYEALVASFQGKHMQPFLCEFDVRVGRKIEPLSHEGEEFHYVLSGGLEFTAGGRTYALGAGDSLYFDATIPHALRARGRTRARTVAVVSSPAT
jgi:transcriptional regulator with XRE-family HTH domain